MRNIEDRDYIECLPPIYRKKYFAWKQDKLPKLEILVEAFASYPVKEVQESLKLSDRDVALLVQLKYFTEEEIDKFGLQSFRELQLL